VLPTAKPCIVAGLQHHDHRSLTIMVRIARVPTAPARSESPGPIPLTHHAILGLVEPFTRRGRALDLPASDRAQRRLRFKPIRHPDQPVAGSALTETLELEHPEDDHFRLRRIITDGHRLTSTLQIEGTDPGILLEQIDAVEVGRQLVAVADTPIARSYRLVPLPGDPVPTDPVPADPVAADDQHPAHWQLQLLNAEARVEGVVLTLNAKTGRKMPADLELQAEQEQRLRVPPDLLAVLGWEWRPMRELGRRWRGSVRVAADEPERTRDVEAKLDQAVAHLARTLRGNRADFHARWQGARWRVTFQRAIPMLIGLALLGSAPLIQFLSLENASLARMFIFHAPPLLLIGIFMMRELPVIEIPPIPRRLIGRDWIVDDTKGRFNQRAVQSAEAG
jgi:hypothetical protein